MDGAFYRQSKKRPCVQKINNEGIVNPTLAKTSEDNLSLSQRRTGGSEVGSNTATELQLRRQERTLRMQTNLEYLNEDRPGYVQMTVDGRKSLYL